MASSASLFNNPFLSDVTIHQIYEGEVKEYYAHKAVLCAHSAFFMNAFSGTFKEASENNIRLHDDDPKLLEGMLRFIYTMKLNIDLSAMPNNSAQEQLTYAINIYALADKYAVDSLQAHIYKLFEVQPRISGSWDGDKAAELVAAHYSGCVRIGCPMGRQVARLVTTMYFIQSKEFEGVLQMYLNFGVDLLMTCPRSSNKLWG